MNENDGVPAKVWVFLEYAIAAFVIVGLSERFELLSKWSKKWPYYNLKRLGLEVYLIISNLGVR